jgi:C-terminal processing protease CtpA/Prc
MSGWKRIVVAVAVLLMAAPAVADQEAPAAEARPDEAGARTFGASARREQRSEAIEVQMREAEERLAEAAARVAELSSSRLPYITRRMHNSMHPVMGVTIGGDEREGPVEGATVSAVTPGSAAAEAGLRAGDVITAINGESFSADDGKNATRKLLDFMGGVEDGDTLDVEYLRNGRAASVAVKPRTMQSQTFALRSGNRVFAVPGAPAAPGVHAAPDAPGFFSFFAGRGSWGDMEMVSLTKDLGRYFGTDKGLLIVRAPEDESLKLRDGDVIQSIDGREPASVTHAMRILGSYQSGETLKIEIMRDKKRQTVSVEMPDNRQSLVREFGFPGPTAVIEPLEPEVR